MKITRSSENFINAVPKIKAEHKIDNRMKEKTNSVSYNCNQNKPKQTTNNNKKPPTSPARPVCVQRCSCCLWGSRPAAGGLGTCWSCTCCWPVAAKTPTAVGLHTL